MIGAYYETEVPFTFLVTSSIVFVSFVISEMSSVLSSKNCATCIDVYIIMSTRWFSFEPCCSISRIFFCFYVSSDFDCSFGPFDVAVVS